jgi:hypothetical protein
VDVKTLQSKLMILVLPRRGGKDRPERRNILSGFVVGEERREKFRHLFSRISQTCGKWVRRITCCFSGNLFVVVIQED